MTKENAINTRRIPQSLFVLAIGAGLAACGGGGGSDQVTQATVPGPGSTIPSAEITGTIQYTHYQATKTVMSDATFTLPTLSANATFNATSKQGTIQFPVLGGTEMLSTSDGYATTTWAGPFTSGSYKLNGNLLMGCNAASQTENQATNVFVSSSLTRLKEGAIDELNGKSFDLIDCGIIKQAAAQTLTVNADGSLLMSIIGTAIPKNEVFGMLNPEKFPGALINGSDPKTRGVYAGHAFRYVSNGVTKYAIVVQTNANSFNDANRYHYMIAIQR